MDGDKLLRISENSKDRLVIECRKNLQIIIENAQLYSPYEYECACKELQDALKGIEPVDM